MQPFRPNRNRNDRREFGDRNRRASDNDQPQRPRHPDAEVDQRIRELDAERDPLTLPEEIVDEANRAGVSVGIPKPDPNSQRINLSQLQELHEKDLITMAQQLAIADCQSLPKQELIIRILKERMKADGLMYGEGTLEILPDGFGFLRSPDYHYMSCPDDIYVSPSQIRRFGMQTGSTVAGQIRPPKENERYFALLRVEVINRRDPMGIEAKVPFDALTPLHPNQRIVLEHDSTEL